MIGVSTELVVAAYVAMGTVFNQALITVHIISIVVTEHAASQMHFITVHVYKLLLQEHLFCAFWFLLVCSMVWKTHLLYLPE